MARHVFWNVGSKVGQNEPVPNIEYLFEFKFNVEK